MADVNAATIPIGVGTYPANESYVRLIKTKIKRSPEERRALKECKTESFLYRCVPFSAIAMTATHWAVKTGYLAPNVTWGSTLKVLGAGSLGYLVGNFSYQKQCAEKLMALPNSKLGEVLRNLYRRDDRQEIEIETDLQSPSLIYAEQAKKKLEQATVYDLDPTENVQHEGLDDSFRPTVDSTTFPTEATPPPQQYVSYEELRKQNRLEYEAKQQEMHRTFRPILPPLYRPSSKTPPNREILGKARNKYGDVWEN